MRALPGYTDAPSKPTADAVQPARFVFAVCQPGAERALKNEVARRHVEWRFAFSRPGFVTFRLPEAREEPPALECVFARAAGVSLGKAVGSDAAARAERAWQRLEEHFGTALAGARHLHVWRRAEPLPGDDGWGPEPPGVRAAAAALLEPRAGAPALAVNQTCEPEALVIDCVLVEDDEWWIGWHRADTVAARWPGGVPPLVAPKRMISRAYLKMREALLWSELPLEPGDRCVEIGSAPGGACLALLERGCVVTGIDPAEMDPEVLAHPSFTHLRARARDVERGVFRDCRWLSMDAHVAPNYTLDAVEEILAQPGVRPKALLLTLKLTDPALADDLPKLAERLRDLGYAKVRMRQLAFNRQEVCMIAEDRAAAAAARLQQSQRRI